MIYIKGPTSPSSATPLNDQFVGVEDPRRICLPISSRENNYFADEFTIHLCVCECDVLCVVLSAVFNGTR